MTDARRSWIRLLLLTCAVIVISLGPAAQITGRASATQSDGNVVTEWNAIAQNAIVTVEMHPIQRSQLWITLMHVAMFDAVNSINGDYEPFKVTPRRLRPASRDAAAISAAHKILVTLLPSQQASLDAAWQMSLANIPDGLRKENGIAIGEDTALRLLAIHDGVIPPVTYVWSTHPGDWQPTPPAYANPLLPGFALVTPLALDSASQFRPGPPPEFMSPVWTRDYNEVKAFGVATGSLRTPEQTEIARFYTEHAVAQYSRAFRRYAIENTLDVPTTARFFAMVNTAILDSQIACWDAKYHYGFWRPVTAIRAGHTDGNDDTKPDGEWIGLATTPPHPEYPAAHGCWTSATATMLEHFNGTNMVHFVLDSAVTRTTHVFENTNDLRSEIIDARVYGGMHFRNSAVVGAILGREVAERVALSFRPKVE
jgi:hypothetical protein